MEIYQNEFFLLEEEDSLVFITVFRKGFSILKFNEILQSHPRVQISRFMVLKKALEEATRERIEVGEMRPLISLTLSDNEMTAKIRINCSEDELNRNRQFYITNVLKVLHENNVQEGVLVDVIQDALVAQKDLIVAKGIEPEHGESAQVRYFQLSERKPTIREDGKADYYDMNFIDEVKKGDWLGEKIPPTDGKPGKTVTGQIVPPKKGRDIKLHYDPKTVGEFEEDGKIVLRALIDGVVTFEGGKISVGDHLVIDGDVGVKTGNIDFDGSVTVKGVISSSFSVVATKDISILGEMGISGVRQVLSRSGDIFIKGGVFGQGETTISAGRNIYVKHANECNLIAKGDIHIGYYSIGSYLKGRNVFTDERKGKIIGGRVEAKAKVVSSIIGNKMERSTFIHIEGINRQKLYEELEEILLQYRKGITEVAKLRKQIETFEQNLENLTEMQKFRYEKYIKELDDKMMIVDTLDEKRKKLMNLLETKGEGEVTMLNVGYPGVHIQIKKFQKKITSPVRGSFYLKGDVLKFD